MGFSEIVRERRAEAMAVSAAIDGRIPIDQIRPNPDQPRREIDEASEEFEELRQSIWQHGLIQPVVVSQPDPDIDSYLLLAGERRWRAFRSLAGADAARFSAIPAVVRKDGLGDATTTALVIGLIENVVREDLRPGDRAAAIARLRTVTDWTHEEIAHRLGLGLRHVQALAAIATNDAVVDALNQGRLTQKQAVVVANATQGDVQMAMDLVGRVQDVPREKMRAAVRQAVVSPVEIPSLPSAGDGEDGGQEVDVVVIRETSIAALKPRVREMERGEFRDMLRRGLRETKVV